MARRTLLFVHAHPDDELLATGVAIAHHVAAGDAVHVLTCTLGEQGEVIPAELAHLTAAQDDTLGPHRREELRAAMTAVGASHEVLGERPEEGVLSVYRDSGMAGSPSAGDPRAWVRADLAEAVGLVGEVIARVRPDVVVTYDEHGGYSHPDHIRTHEVVRTAVAALPGGERPLLYGTLTPRSWAEQDRAWLREHGPGGRGWTQPDGEHPASVVADELVTHAVVDPAAARRRAEALRHHRTQVVVDPPRYALSNDIAARLGEREGYALLDPATGRPLPGDGGPRRGLLDDLVGREQCPAAQDGEAPASTQDRPG